jgi:hypothetical protein
MPIGMSAVIFSLGNGTFPKRYRIMLTTDKLNFILGFNQLFKQTLSIIQENITVMDEFEMELQTFAQSGMLLENKVSSHIQARAHSRQNKAAKEKTGTVGKNASSTTAGFIKQVQF